MLFDVPVDHYPFALVPQVPLGHQVLIPGPELCGVGGAGGRAFSPDVGLAHLENGIGHIYNRSSQVFLVDEAATGVDQFVVALPMLSLADALEARIGPHPIEA